MPELSKTLVDKHLRDMVFNNLFGSQDEAAYDYHKINDRQYGVLLTDDNNVQRYVRIGVIVAEEREDMSAEELMNSEVAAYNEAQAKKAEKKRKAEEKAAADKKRREEKAAENEGG